MQKRRVIPINDDGGLGKIMSGEQYVREEFPELFTKPVDNGPTTDPIDQPGPITPPIVEQPPIVVPPKPEPKPEKPSVLTYPRTLLGRSKATGCQVWLVKFPDKDRIVEDYTPIGYEWVFEKFGVCGFDFEINYISNLLIVTGAATGNFGMNTPPDFVCPPDFVVGNWPGGDDGKPGRKFFVWKQSKLNTEPVKPDVVPPTPKPETPDRVVTIEDGAKNFSPVIETGSALIDGESTTYIRTT